jgi:hypothetical protein
LGHTLSIILEYNLGEFRISRISFFSDSETQSNTYGLGALLTLHTCQINLHVCLAWVIFRATAVCLGEPPTCCSQSISACDDHTKTALTTGASRCVCALVDVLNSARRKHHLVGHFLDSQSLEALPSKASSNDDECYLCIAFTENLSIKPLTDMPELLAPESAPLPDALFPEVVFSPILHHQYVAVM